MMSPEVSRRIAVTYEDKPVTHDERIQIADGAADAIVWDDLPAAVDQLLEDIAARHEIENLPAVTTVVEIIAPPLWSFHLPGGHNQGTHGHGGATGAAALRAAPLRLVDNKVDPVLGKVRSKPGPGMTADEGKALSRYREAGFVKVNRSLRKTGGDIPKGTDGKTVTEIDSAMSRSKLTGDISVERGIGNGPSAFGDRWQSDMTGTTFVDHGFVSTTASHSIAGEFGDRIPGVSDGATSRLYVPAGVSAIQLSGSGPFQESELLLDRGLTYEITSDTGPGAGREITMVVRP